MAKSKIIKELANNDISLEVALNRLMIIASDIENEELSQWAERELNGYKNMSDLPVYRIITNARFVYSGINGRFKVTHAPLPLAEMMGYKNNEIPVNIPDGIQALNESISGNVEYARDMTSMAGVVYQKTGVSCTVILQIVPQNAIENILSTIKSKLLKVLIRLDKEYGSLDDLDIDISTKTPEEIHTINVAINNYIFEDRSIKIGDKNRIDSTDIRS